MEPIYNASLKLISPETSKSAFVTSKAISTIILSLGIWKLANLYDVILNIDGLISLFNNIFSMSSGLFFMFFFLMPHSFSGI